MGRVFAPSLASPFRYGTCAGNSITSVKRRIMGMAASSPSDISSSSSNNDKYGEGGPKQSAKKKHTIRWRTPSDDLDDQISFHAFDGELLRTAALRRGLVSPHNGRANAFNCRGLGTCGTCAVEIEGDSLTDRNAIETFRLSVPPGHGRDSTGTGTRPPLRLACQVPVRGDLVVTKRTGFWGQYDDVAKPSKPTKPLGELEFILDKKSPET